MRPDVSRPTATLRRLAAIACVLILSASACSSLPEGEVEGPQGREFLSTVPDSVDDVGLGNSITVDDAGLPVVAYFGFVAQLQPGEIPVTRPVGSPFLQTEDGDDAGAVLLASLSTDQYWNRGAVAQPRETPSGVTVPFGPAAEPSLASLTPSNAKGTDVVARGTDIHVVWTANTGVWYGAGPSFEIGSVEETREAGAPSIAADDSGAPLVAYTTAGARPEVRLAERAGERWRITTVTTLSACGEGCPPATQVGILGGEPVVVVADPRSGQLIAAQRQGGTWATEVVARGVTGGASLATAGDSATIAFYTESGVAVATGRFGEWAVDEVAPVTAAPDETSPTPSASPTATPVNTGPTTGVAVGGEGTTWVTWEDRDGIHLASAAEGEPYEEVEASHTDGGVTPSVAVTEDGASVYVAWFDPVEADLRVGIYAEATDIVIAQPSPTAPPAAPPDVAGCGDDGKPILEIAASGLVFDKNCLVAPAGDPFTITFDNQDAAPITHNVAIFPDAESTDAVFAEPPFAGPRIVEYNVDALDPDTYAFRCEVHPTTMTGVLAAIEVDGGGGGGA